MKNRLVIPPVVEPITLSELKLHLRLDSGTFADNIDEVNSTPPGVYDIDYELMILDVAPSGAGWSVGDTITGASSGKTSTIVNVLSTLTYIVTDRSGDYTLGEILSNGISTADQGPLYPTFSTGYNILGSAIDVLGVTAVVLLISGTTQPTGTLDVKIQESDNGTTWLDWTDGAFTQVTPANDNTVYEITYTGIRRYIRTVAYAQVAPSEYNTVVIRRSPMVVEDDLLNNLITTAREHVELTLTRRAMLTQTWEYYLDKWPRENYIKLPYGRLQNLMALKYIESDGTEIILKEETDSIMYDTQAIAADYTTHVGTSVYVLGYTTVVTLTSGTNGTSGTVDVKIQESDDDIVFTDWVGGAFTQITTTNDNNVYTLDYTGDKLYIRTVAMVLVAPCEFGTSITISTPGETLDYSVELNGDECGRIVLNYGTSWPSTPLSTSNPITIRYKCGLVSSVLIPQREKSAVKMIAAKLYEGRGEDMIGQAINEDKFYERLITSKLYDEFE